MPKTTITTTTEVKLSPRLEVTVGALLNEYVSLLDTKKDTQEKIDETKEAIETVIADADEYDALIEGVRVDDIPLKLIGGETNILNKKKLMRKFGLTPADLKSVTDTKAKKMYLGVTLPKEKE